MARYLIPIFAVLLIAFAPLPAAQAIELGDVIGGIKDIAKEIEDITKKKEEKTEEEAEDDSTAGGGGDDDDAATSGASSSSPTSSPETSFSESEVDIAARGTFFNIRNTSANRLVYKTLAGKGFHFRGRTDGRTTSKGQIFFREDGLLVIRGEFLREENWDYLTQIGFWTSRGGQLCYRVKFRFDPLSRRCGFLNIRSDKISWNDGRTITTLTPPKNNQLTGLGSITGASNAYPIREDLVWKTVLFAEHVENNTHVYVVRITGTDSDGVVDSLRGGYIGTVRAEKILVADERAGGGVRISFKEPGDYRKYRIGEQSHFPISNLLTESSLKHITRPMGWPESAFRDAAQEYKSSGARWFGIDYIDARNCETTDGCYLTYVDLKIEKQEEPMDDVPDTIPTSTSGDGVSQIEPWGQSPTGEQFYRISCRNGSKYLYYRRNGQWFNGLEGTAQASDESLSTQTLAVKKCGG